LTTFISIRILACKCMTEVARPRRVADAEPVTAHASDGDFSRIGGTIQVRENYAICVLGIDTSNSKAAADCISAVKAYWQPLLLIATIMKDFSNASFPPEVISVMEAALDAAVASLPEPVHSSHVQAIAEAILRAAHGGEGDPVVLKRLALMELQLVQR
jgi:hypothetical protein